MCGLVNGTNKKGLILVFLDLVKFQSCQKIKKNILGYVYIS